MVNILRQKSITKYKIISIFLNLFKKKQSDNILGLHDKNGVEIYEADIIKLKYENKNYLVWVEYSEKYAQFEIRCHYSIIDNEPLGDLYENRIEVIGNKFDNPELLEEE